MRGFAEGVLDRLPDPAPSRGDTPSVVEQPGHVADAARMVLAWKAAGTRLKALGAFWMKINNDWIFNLAGVLAYNFLMALFPMVLLLLAGFGVVLGSFSRSVEHTLERSIAALLPGDTGVLIVSGVSNHLKQSVGPLLVIGLVTSVVAGSRLFISLENCFGIVFRLQGRSPVQQNGMAFGMLLLYLILVPVVFLTSILPTDLLNLVDPHGQSAMGGFLITVARPVIMLAAAALLFGVTYALVPNRPLNRHTWQWTWKGTLVAAVLLLLYETLFQLYLQNVLHADNYGSVAAFAIVILLFFYYLAVILLLGAEVNSWSAGQRETAADLPGILHAVQAHRSLRGAAGPTAGLPQEEMQDHKTSRLARYVNAAVTHAQRGIASSHNKLHGRHKSPTTWTISHFTSEAGSGADGGGGWPSSGSGRPSAG